MVHAAGDDAARQAADALRSAYALGEAPPEPPVVLEVLR
jgi:hypothetical protein